MEASFRTIKVLGRGSFGVALLVETVAEPHKRYVIKQIKLHEMKEKDRQAALLEAQVGLFPVINSDCSLALASHICVFLLNVCRRMWFVARCLWELVSLCYCFTLSLPLCHLSLLPLRHARTVPSLVCPALPCVALHFFRSPCCCTALSSSCVPADSSSCRCSRV
jgi:hypothetical protein